MENLFTEVLPSANSIMEKNASLILNNLPDFLLLVDKKLRIVSFNFYAAEKVQQLLQKNIYAGMPVLDLVSEGRRPAFLNTVRKVLKGETCTTHNDTVSSNEEVYENDFYPVRNKSGKVTGFIIRSVNITHRQKVERAVQDAEERWQFAFEASNQAAWDWNMQTNEIIYSSSYKKMYGFLGDDDLQNDLGEWQKRIHPDDKGLIEKALREHAQSDNPYYETRYRIQAKNGDYKWIMARGKVLNRDANGKPLRMIGTHTDLTQTFRTKAEISEMNQRFHYAAKASLQALWEWNVITREAYVSPSFTEMFGWSADKDNRFDQWHQCVHPDERKTIVEDYYYTLEKTNETIWRASYRFLKADGTYAFVNDRAYILRDEQGRATKVIGATQDVTTLKRTEEELRQSNERYEIVMEAANEMLWEWDIKNDCIYRSAQGLNKVYGVANNESIKSIGQWKQRIHPEDWHNVHAILDGLLTAKHRQTFEVEYRFRKDNGEYAHIINRGVLLKDDDNLPARMIGAAQNISERKRLERELLQNELEMKKRINQATVDSQEQERSEIGRELHDNVNQVLTTTRLYLELAQSHPEMRDELLAKSSANIGNVISEIRQLSRSLMDPTLGDLGIVDALNDLVENLILTGKIRINLRVDDAVESALTKAQKLTIFRIIQESLNNVIKHASANFVAVSVQCKQAEASLEIKDDGVGFSPALMKRGAGLNNITNRVYLINGNFILESNPGEGCAIKINFPITKTD